MIRFGVQIKIDDDDDDNNDDEDICCSVRSTKYATFAVQKKLISWKNVIKTGMYQYYW